jgi:TolA-binding protein
MKSETKQQLREQIESLESRIVELQKQEHLRRPNTIVLTNEEVAQILDLVGRAKRNVGDDIHERELQMNDDLSSDGQIALYQYECSLELLCKTITNQCASEFAFRTATQKVEVKV